MCYIDPYSIYIPSYILNMFMKKPDFYKIFKKYEAGVIVQLREH